MMRNWKPNEKKERIILDSLRKNQDKKEKDHHHHHVAQKYRISGRRLGQLETKILRGLSNLSNQLEFKETSSSSFVNSMHLLEESIKMDERKHLLEPDSPKTPIIVVGYPKGYPRGLHILGNRSGPGKDHHHHHQNESILPTEQDKTVRNQKPLVQDRPHFEEDSILTAPTSRGKDDSNTATRSKSFSRFNQDPYSYHPSDIARGNSLLGNSKSKKGGKTDNIFINSSGLSLKSKTLLIHHDEKEQKSMRKIASDKKALKTSKGSTVKPVSGVPIAPWRDISQFQSKAEHRRQTFYNFKIMSPEPPKTPVTQDRISRHSNHQNRNIQSFTSRQQAFPAIIGSSIGASKSLLLNKKRDSGGIGKSMTGLSLSRTLVKTKKKQSLTCHMSPGHSNNFSSATKSTAGVTSLTSKKSLVAVNDRGAGQKDTLNVNSNPWTNMVQTNQIPIPPSKRLEQVRMMNHIINGYTHNNNNNHHHHHHHNYKHGAHEIREKYSYPLQQTGRRQHGPITKTNQYHHITSIATTTTSSQQQQQQSQVRKSVKVPLMPPVSTVPGPKRENIYIGHYDGSDDSDSGTETESKKPETQNKFVENPKTTESIPD